MWMMIDDDVDDDLHDVNVVSKWGLSMQQWTLNDNKRYMACGHEYNNGICRLSYTSSHEPTTHLTSGGSAIISRLELSSPCWRCDESARTRPQHSVWPPQYRRLDQRVQWIRYTYMYLSTLQTDDMRLVTLRRKFTNLYIYRSSFIYPYFTKMYLNLRSALY